MSKAFKNIGYILIISSLYSPSLYAYRKTQEDTTLLDSQKKKQRKKPCASLSWSQKIWKNKTTLLAILIPSVLFIGVVGIGRYFLAKEAQEKQKQQIQLKKAADQEFKPLDPLHGEDSKEDISYPLLLQAHEEGRKKVQRIHDRPRQTQEKLQKKPQVQKHEESHQTQPGLQKKLQEEITRRKIRYYPQYVIEELLRQLVEGLPPDLRENKDVRANQRGTMEENKNTTHSQEEKYKSPMLEKPKPLNQKSNFQEDLEKVKTLLQKFEGKERSPIYTQNGLTYKDLEGVRNILKEFEGKGKSPIKEAGTISSSIVKIAEVTADVISNIEKGLTYYNGMPSSIAKNVRIR